MRKSVMVSLIFHVLAGGAVLLWLLWGFLPSGSLFKGLMTACITALVVWLVWRKSRSGQSMAAGEASVFELPPFNAGGPVVLVCGDELEALFQGHTLRKTAQGWWLRMNDVNRLGDMVRDIYEQQPGQTGQLAVMYVCQPDRHQDEAVLRASLKALRQQIKHLSQIVGFSLPVILSGEFPGPETPWIVVRGDKPVANPVDETPQALDDWQQDNHLALMPVLREAFAFMRTILVDELAKEDRLFPSVHPFAVAIRSGMTAVDTASLWSHHLCRLTHLVLPKASGLADVSGRFPDAVLPVLAPYCVPVQGGQRTRRLVLLVLACMLAALGFSAANNAALIRQVGTDLQRWYAIPMNHYEPKAQSLAALKQDALLLERWQRQGEPLRYALGYYPGQRLWLALQKAIDSYVPSPAPAMKPVPKIIRLDSMSLFDTGKWVLKPGTTKLLVNSLVGIKAKPGWLIVVAGHTDSTGDDPSNQVLSLKRAESVRDWMRDTGDVPESCFAVQGYGESRPVATNDTTEGRALNRRVEISLVPQANACQQPDITPAPLEDDGVSKNEME
ncbi:TPA: OmpA family protein [Enterobacter mori]|uniref:OmpA family protein n=1 Tax=Enterobacter mori TaxID=539813 RepID=UPI0022368925|nr:OmpA family protein [Enterobacter mori]MCW4986396.1 OmpA family protein [Enterobacter mori]MEB7566844.1 OmpA family protein [Enterobacter mori]HDR2834967.1 OmpA family protein [Enterobacter mori]